MLMNLPLICGEVNGPQGLVLDCKYRTKGGVQTCYIPMRRYVGIIGSSLNVCVQRLRAALKQNEELRTKLQHLEDTVKCHTATLGVVQSRQASMGNDVEELQETQRNQAQSIAQLRKMLRMMRQLSGRLNVVRNRLGRCEGHLRQPRRGRSRSSSSTSTSTEDHFDLDFWSDDCEEDGAFLD